MEFFEAIFGERLTDEFIELLVVTPPPPGSTERGPGRSYYASNVAELNLLIDKYSSPDKHIFFGVAPRTQKRSRKDDVARTSVVWADIDSKDFTEGRTAAYSAIEQYPFPPSMLVDSGNGYHAYWLLSELVDSATAEAIMQSIRKVIGSDAVCYANAVLRVPGTFNVKNGGHLACTLLRTRYDLRYQPRDLVAICNIEPRWRKIILSGGSGAYADRSDKDWAIAVALMRLGISNDGILTLFRERAVGDKYRDKGEKGDYYLNLTLENARKSLGEVDNPEDIPGQFFIEKDDCYYVRDSKGGMHQVSTFVVDPKRVYISDKNETPDVFVADIRAGGRVWENITISKSAFHRLAELSGALKSVHWQWLGSDREVRFLLPYLVSRWAAMGYPNARMTSIIGRYEDLWIHQDGVISAQGALKSLESPIVYVSTGRDPPPTRYDITVDANAYRALVHDLAESLHLVNVPHVSWPIIGWFFATPYKTLLNERQVRFPFLNLFGSMGSGKTSMLLNLFLPLFGYTDAHSRDCSTTHFALLALLSSTRDVPVYLTEFRRSTLADREFNTLKRMLLQAYDMGKDARGRPDQTVQEYELAAPIILDGEDAIQDGAILQRMVVVSPEPDNIIPGSLAYNTFNRITKQDLTAFAGHYIQHTLRSDTDEVYSRWLQAHEELKPILKEVPDRVHRNLATVWFGVHEYARYLESWGSKVAMPPPEVLLGPLENVVNQSLGTTLMQVDDFIISIINEFALLKNTSPFFAKWDPTTNIFWFQLTSAFSWWQRRTRQEGGSVITSAQMKAQLKQRHEQRGNGPAYYIIGPAGQYYDGATKWMYGVSIQKALQAGFDIPSEPNFYTATLRIPKEDSDYVDNR